MIKKKNQQKTGLFHCKGQEREGNLQLTTTALDLFLGELSELP